MALRVHHPKDFWTGIIFFVLGLAAVVIGQDYAMGTAGRLGPGYFPTILGALLALIGAIGVVRACFHVGEPIGRFHIRELVLVLSSVILFGVLMRGAGLVPAVIVLVLLSAFTSPKLTWLPHLVLAFGLAASSFQLRHVRQTARLADGGVRSLAGF